MFNEISGYYDKMNNLISLGSHYIIKFLSIKALDIKPNSMILDACCGTGDFQKSFQIYPTVKVIGLDFQINDKTCQTKKT